MLLSVSVSHRLEGLGERRRDNGYVLILVPRAIRMIDSGQLDFSAWDEPAPPESTRLGTSKASLTLQGEY